MNDAYPGSDRRRAESFSLLTLRQSILESDNNDAKYNIWDAKDENRVNVFDADGVQVDTYERE